MNYESREERNKKVAEFIKEQKKQGGIVPSTIKPGSVVFIETEHLIFKLTKRSDGKLVIDGAAKYIREDQRILSGVDSHYIPLKHDINDWIGKDMRPIWRFVDGQSVMVGEVVGAEVIGPGEEFRYELWK